MKTNFSKQQARIAAACGLALCAMSGIAGAQTGFTPVWGPQDERALVVNSPGQVWMNSYGDCWHSQFGPPPAPGLPCGQPVVQAAAPAAAAPAPVLIAQAPVYEKVKFDANVLFDFDKSVLTSAGRNTLDDFAAKINGIGSLEILAIGYADRFGSDGYNQALSERRVATVKDYLTGKGIDGKWVHSSAKGETQPTTKSGECSGLKTSSTIACLQPDRHVFVEMSGSRLKQ